MRTDELEDLLRRSAAGERARVRVDLTGRVLAAIAERRAGRARLRRGAGVAASLAASLCIALALRFERTPPRPERSAPLAVAQDARTDSPWGARLSAWLTGVQAPLERELDGVLRDSRGLYRSLSRRLPRPLALGPAGDAGR